MSTDDKLRAFGNRLGACMDFIKSMLPDGTEVTLLISPPEGRPWAITSVKQPDPEQMGKDLAYAVSFASEPMTRDQLGQGMVDAVNRKAN